MKVSTQQSVASTPGLVWRRLLRIALVGCGVLLVSMAALLLLRPNLVQEGARQLEARWGYVFRAADAGLTEKWSIALGVYLRETLDGVPQIPELVLDVPFKEIRKIYAKRQEALERGILIQGTDDFVKGDIRLDGRTVPIKLRLKGDWNDHLAGRKWSFRVRVRGGDQLFGMRRFSLQNPNTRGFQAELLYFHVLNDYAVMTPRYSFANVTLNGDAMGLMAVEEFFAKELLEHRRRREGVIVRYDESLAWSAQDAITGEAVGWGGAFDSYRNAAVDGIGSAGIAESPALLRQYRVAEGLLRGFAERRLTASEVFDVDQLGAFLAVSDYFGAWHAVAWHNLRFYLNPVSLKLEPIGFDATLQDRFDDDRSVMNDEPVVADMLRDPRIWARYAAVLAELRERTTDGSLAAELREVEAQYLPILQTEFRMLGQFPLGYLGPRVDALTERAQRVARADDDSHLRFVDPREREQYPVLAHFGLLAGPPAELRIDSAVPKAVTVTAVDWVNPAGTRVAAVADGMLPLTLSPRGIGADPETRLLALLAAPNADGARLEIRAGLTGRDWTNTYTADEIFPALDEVPLPRVNLAALRKLEYVELNEATGSARLRAGSWVVERTLVLPSGWSLQAGPGTQLTFAADAGLLVSGTVSLVGTAADPVRLGARPAGTWLGLVVMNAPGRSRLEHVVVSDTSSVATADWVLTGGANFYYSDVDIVQSEFLESAGEDALNIIHSDFALVDSLIAGTASDAFDADFARGRVSGSTFRDIGRAGGGDAIDVSGSEVEVVGVTFVDVSDKALSVGERSSMAARELEFTNVGTGAAAKDGSRLELSAARIAGASFAGLTAYIKKPEYGPAKISAQDVTMSAVATAALAQTDSVIELDGALVPTQDVDVDALYETIMRPGLRK